MDGIVENNYHSLVILCHCSQINEKALLDYLARHGCTLEEACQHLGIGQGCQKCEESLLEFRKKYSLGFKEEVPV